MDSGDQVKMGRYRKALRVGKQKTTNFMKKLLLICAISCSMTAFPQPTILDGNNIPASGFLSPVSIATSTAGGSSGANQTWNFSSLSYTPAGLYTVITPSSSSMASSFPTANFAYTFGGTTSFFNVSSTKMEVQAYAITAPGSGNDYTPNPRTNLKFPFAYLDTQIDSWQKVSSSVSSVTLTYDAYGTLITPSNTYTNVVRVKEDYGLGGVDYQWYILNPLMAIAVFDHNTNILYHMHATQIAGLAKNKDVSFSFNLYPNPTKDNFVAQLDDFNFQSSLKLNVLNVLGQVTKVITIKSNKTIVNTSELKEGVYFYQLQDENNTLRTGKIVIE